MVRKIKKGLACALVAALAFTCAAPVTANAAGSPTTAPQPVKQSSASATVGGVKKSTVSTAKNGTATLKAIGKTSKKSISVASTVKVGKVTYKVTTVGANAFKKATKATKVTLPSTVTKISSKAFSGAKKVKTVVLKGKKVSVNKNAFKGLSKAQKSKIVVKYNKKMSKADVKKLKKQLKAAGIKTKNIKKA